MIFEAQVTNASLHQARPYGSQEQVTYDDGDLPAGMLHTGDKVILATENGRTFLVSRPAYQSGLQPSDIGVVTSSMLADAAVTRSKILADAVTTVAIAQGAVTRALIATDAIDGTKIEPNSISSEHVIAGSLSAYHIAANSIDASKIAAYSIAADNISANAITADKILANEITADKIAIGTLSSASGVFGDIDAADITTGNLNADRIVGGTITGVTVDADTITTGTLQATRINGGTAGAFNGSNITNLNATEITTGSLNADRIQGGNISGDLIQGGVINGTTIHAGTITTGTLEATRINGGTAGTFNGSNITNLNATAITTGSLDATLITTGFLSADYIQGGQVTGDIIQGGTITGVTITGGTITGGTVQTSTSGTRVIMNGNTGRLQFYGETGIAGDLYGWNGSIYSSFPFYSDVSPSVFRTVYSHRALGSGHQLPSFSFLGDTDTGMYSDTLNEVGMSAGATSAFRVLTTGTHFDNKLWGPGMTVSAAGGVSVSRYGSAGNEIYAQSSSARLKENIADASYAEVQRLLSARIRTFDALAEVDGTVVPVNPGKDETERGISWDRIGGIAEEWAEDYPSAVVYDDQGDPVGIDTAVVAFGTLKLLQELEHRVSHLEMS